MKIVIALAFVLATQAAHANPVTTPIKNQVDVKSVVQCVLGYAFLITVKDTGSNAASSGVSSVQMYGESRSLSHPPQPLKCESAGTGVRIIR